MRRKINITKWMFDINFCPMCGQNLAEYINKKLNFVAGGYMEDLCWSIINGEKLLERDFIKQGIKSDKCGYP